VDLVFTTQAKEDLDELTLEQVTAIKEQLEALQRNPTSHEHAKLIRIQGRQLYRLKVKEGRSGRIDHRVIYDINDETIRIYSIFHRDHGYNHPK